MCVEALGLVVFMVEGAPLRLKVEHVELEVFLCVTLNGMLVPSGLNQVQKADFDVLD